MKTIEEIKEWLVKYLLDPSSFKQSDEYQMVDRCYRRYEEIGNKIEKLKRDQELFLEAGTRLIQLHKEKGLKE